MNHKSAYPWSIDNGESIKGEKGMTLRDYFAAKAMQALVTNNGTNPFEITKAAYVLADFMMKEREQ